MIKLKSLFLQQYNIPAQKNLNILNIFKNFIALWLNVNIKTNIKKFKIFDIRRINYNKNNIKTNIFELFHSISEIIFSISLNLANIKKDIKANLFQMTD